ncbi:MAG: hypothetical protein JWL95_1250 [Gemmatimonadetes bacterium]|nr:hypothetical protein [Gemmatimonadota bacterium]
MVSLSRPLAIALLVGTLLLGVGAALHPMLPADVPGQLQLIATTWYFRPVHLAMLAGSALLIAGVWTRGLIPGSQRDASLIMALALICLGLCFNAIDIAFMGNAGWHMATQYQAGDSSVVPLFDALHRFGLTTARFGNCLVALGALALGSIERHDAESPWWLAWLAWLAAAGGLLGVLVVSESSLLILSAVTLIPGWCVGTAVWALRGR